jgi:acetophenone carboxylase
VSAATAPWRRRLSELGRGVGKSHAPLFAPLAYAVASQIEALPPAQVTADPTRLGKCLTELRRVLGTVPLVVAAPAAMEAEALGAGIDYGTWPPRIVAPAPAGVVLQAEFDDAWSASGRLAASLETTRRLAATQGAEAVLVAALTGPAALLAQVLGEGAAADAEAFEFAARALAALARQFAQAGAAAIVLCEAAAPPEAEHWQSALNTIANIARFHRIPAMLSFAGGEPEPWPAATVPCPSQVGEPAQARPHGLTVPADPAAWSGLPGNTGNARVVLTAGEVPADSPIEALREAAEAALDMQREAP